VKAIATVVRKEFQQIRRDRRMLVIIFLSPIFQVLILGYAANMDVKNIALGVVDPDRSAAGRALVAEFTNSEYFSLKEYSPDAESLEHDIRDGHVSIGVVLPRDFERDLESGRSTSVQLLVDGSESNNAVIGQSYATQIIGRFSASSTQARLGRLGLDLRTLAAGVNPQPRVLFNPELSSRSFLVPGILAMILLVMTVILTSLSIVKEKERGTMEQLIVTPLRPYQLIVGKLTPFILISFVMVTIVVVSCFTLFNIGVKGSVLLLYLLTAEFLLSTLGLGLLVSTFARNQQQAMMISIFFLLFPMVILSGFVFPIENMPPFVQWVTYLFPLRYYFVIIRGLFLKGVGLAQLWREALALLVFGAVIIGVSIFRFRSQTR
jgi:ABC-2 type transport system permease protein